MTPSSGAATGNLEVAEETKVSVGLAATVTALAFVVLFGRALTALAREWWSNPDVSHGLLLVPVALLLAWRRGLARDSAGSPWLGSSIVAVAVAIRLLAGFAAELYMLRVSVLVALAGLVVHYRGVRQLAAWWLPFVLLAMAIPLPEVLISTVTLPLQLFASELGATLLSARHIPVQLHGNVIRLPGQELFVTEACSGLRSLTALLSLGVLAGAQWLATVPARALLVLLTIPIAVLVNSLRVFLTGFLVHYVGSEAGTGFLHLTEGWLMFIGALLAVAMAAGAGVMIEARLGLRRRNA